MRRILFVSNGHGESTIAERIAREVSATAGGRLGLDHLALVGEPGSGALAPVGPRKNMPSGGLVAMGNVAALTRDIGAGLLGLASAQARFLRREGARYDGVVSVGDVYALALAGLTRRPVIFVGTAKSVRVAAYGPFERVLLRRASRVFVRDAATAAHLRSHGVAADAPGNTIVELGDDAPPPPPEFAGRDAIAVLPGSRTTAYADAVRLAAVIRALGERAGPTRGLLSLAPGLEAERFARALSDDGWSCGDISAGDDVAFRARAGSAEIAGWRGPFGTLLRSTHLVLGLAGTANEQAAAAGLPVVALDVGDDWYRMRQRRLLGAAMTLIPQRPGPAAAALAGLLGDASRLESMREAGRERMGPPGGSRAIAAAIVEFADAE
jgi:uncharacterized protein (TIGR03492 family)